MNTREERKMDKFLWQIELKIKPKAKKKKVYEAYPELFKACQAVLEEGRKDE